MRKVNQDNVNKLLVERIEKDAKKKVEMIFDLSELNQSTQKIIEDALEKHSVQYTISETELCCICKPETFDLVESELKKETDVIIQSDFSEVLENIELSENIKDEIEEIFEEAVKAKAMSLFLGIDESEKQSFFRNSLKRMSLVDDILELVESSGVLLSENSDLSIAESVIEDLQIQVEELEREKIITRVCDGLTETQKEKVLEQSKTFSFEYPKLFAEQVLSAKEKIFPPAHSIEEAAGRRNPKLSKYINEMA